MQAVQRTYLQFVDYSSFARWDVKRYKKIKDFSFEKAYKLSDILIPFKQPVSKEEMAENGWQIISKINFGGELFLRDFNEIGTYKGSLNLVPDNAIIYSKINVRHGCIYYHKKGETPFGVSSEYPTYTFDTKKVNGFFLQKLLRSSEFKKLLNTKTSGISKARVKQDEFLDLEIPLPTLSEQEKLVAAYNEKIQKAEQLALQGNDLEAEIEKYFLEQIGLQPYAAKEKSFGLFTINYTELERWDFFSGDAKVNSLLSKSKYPIVTLGKAFEIVKRTWNKKVEKKDRFNYIEIGAIDPIEGIREAKEVLTSKAPSRATQTVKTGDLIIGTTRPYLKKFAIVNKQYDGDVCSSGFTVIAAKKEYYLPYLLQFLRCSYGVEQLKNKMTGGLYPAITESELKENRLPLPDVITQEKIMTLIKEKEAEIINSREVIENLKHKAQQEFEQAIFSQK